MKKPPQEHKQGDPYFRAKADEAKPRPTLLPTPALRAVLQVLEYGAQKYAPHSWRNVPDARRRYLDAMGRHYLDCIEHGPFSLDAESGLTHLSHLTCNAVFLLALGPEDEPCWD